MKEIEQQRQRRPALARDPAGIPSVDDSLPEDEKEALEAPSSSLYSRLARAKAEVIAVEDPSVQEGEVVSFRRVVNSRMLPKPEARLTSLDAKDPAAAEFRVLAARLNKLKTQYQLKRVLVIACEAGSGSSVVCANLALTLAHNPAHKVLLIEGNLGQPSLAARFGIEASKGLSEYLTGTDALESVIRYLSPGGIWFLSAGTPPRDPEGRIHLLRSPRLSTLLRQEADWFDWVIVDSPPLETGLMTGVLMQLCDGLLIVVRKCHTTKKLLRRSLAMLDGVPILGCALNELAP